MYIQYLYHSLYTMVAKMNVNLRRLLICDTFSPGNSSPDHTLHSANSYKASCNTAFINSDYMKKKMYSRSIAKSMLYSLDRIEEIVREHRQKTNNLNLPQTNIFADINIRNIQTTSNNTCSVCQQRDKTKQESLESIKRNILSRLHLSYPPNVPTRPVVPNNILDSFQTQCAYKGVLAESRLKKDFPLHKIPAMAPATFSLNEFIALYTADDELMAQQTHVDFSHYTKRAEEVKTSRWILNTVHRDSTNTHNTPQNSGTNHGWYTSLNSVYIFPKNIISRGGIEK
uniref:Uncharacterized protein n=1 Tax=Stomoxys calcitrans TaxID=35570 RepID=A0A1I8NZ18_STOCA